jgi:hypothetical protein
MSDHDFCRTMLRLAREEAKAQAVEVPKNLTAISADKRQYFVEMDGRSGEYVAADCSYDARAKFIHGLIDKQRRAS